MITLLFGLLGCAPVDGTDATDSPGPMGVSEVLHATGSHYALALAFDGSPAVGDNSAQIDVSDAEGAPTSACSMQVASWMPEHGHGGMSDPDVRDLGDGAYD